MEIARWYLAVFFCGVGLFYIVRIQSLASKLEQPVTYMGTRWSLHWVTHRLFRIFRMAIFLACLARVPYPSVDAWLVPIAALWHPAVLLAGCLLLTLSFAGLVVINLYMNGYWRSGTRPDDVPALITTGPFAISQNPMTLLILLGQLGFFLALPSLFSLVCLAVGVWAVIAQTGVERGVLAEKFGDDYRDYALRTPRFLFR